MKPRCFLLMILLTVCPLAWAADPPADPRAELAAMRLEIEQMRVDLKKVRADLDEARQALHQAKQDMTPEAAADFTHWRTERESLRREQMATRREQYRATQDREQFTRQSAAEEDRRQQAKVLAQRQANRPGEIPMRSLLENPFAQENAVPYLRIQTTPLFFGNPWVITPYPFIYRPGVNFQIIPR